MNLPSTHLIPPAAYIAVRLVAVSEPTYVRENDTALPGLCHLWRDQQASDLDKERHYRVR